MAKKDDKWNWKIGEVPPSLDPHSKVKHQLVTDYLQRYIAVLMANERMPSLKLTLVDGFAGGGLYTEGTNLALGSPLLLLQTVKEAEARLNIKRIHSNRKVDAHYHFVELNPSNFAYLKNVLSAEGYNSRIGKDIALYLDDFENVCSSIVSSAKQRKGGERVLFLLDQYAYDDIKMSTIKNVMSNLQGAEVILTFNVDSLLAFLTNSEHFHQITRKIGLEQYIDWEGYARLKAQARWREIIQRQIALGIWKASGARFMTLFFVTPRGNNPWSYWLVHLSNAYKANDVMKEVHWEHGNSFGHSLEPGLFQLGYQANQDEQVTGQSGFSFGDTAAFDEPLRKASIDTLQEYLPKIIYDNQNGVPFIHLLENIANQTNATSDIVRESLHEHIRTKDLCALKADGGARIKASAIHQNDTLVPNRQKSIFLFG